MNSVRGSLSNFLTSCKYQGSHSTTLPFKDADDRKDANKILDTLKKHFIGSSNVTYGGTNSFNTRTQRKGEPVDSFLGVIKVLTQLCEFETLADSLIHDKIVCSIVKENTRKKFQVESKLDLDKAIAIRRADESAELQSAEMNKVAMQYKS